MNHDGAWGPFADLRRIGTGGTAVVWAGVYRGLPVAIKVPASTTPTARASFEREISAMAGLHHPGIARIVERGVEAGTGTSFLEARVQLPERPGCIAGLVATARRQVTQPDPERGRASWERERGGDDLGGLVELLGVQERGRLQRAWTACAEASRGRGPRRSRRPRGERRARRPRPDSGGVPRFHPGARPSRLLPA